jgi:hypothetical protein
MFNKKEYEVEKDFICKCGSDMFYPISKIVFTSKYANPGQLKAKCCNCGLVYDHCDIMYGNNKKAIVEKNHNPEEDMRYIYDCGVGNYFSNEIEEDEIRKMLRSDGCFCTRVLIFDKLKNKTITYIWKNGKVKVSR